MEQNKKVILTRPPIDGEIKISSPFGIRVLNGKPEFHKGIDYAIPVGTALFSVGKGKVLRAGWEDPDDPKRGYGLRIMQHIATEEGQFIVWYGHMNIVSVKEGDLLEPGHLIGFSGNTGRSTGPHLHLGCRGFNSSEFFDIDFKSKEVV